MNQVILLSGPPGAGKTAVAEAICERYDRVLHIEVDDLRHWVKAGYRRPWDVDAQAREQADLAIRNACAVARESIATHYSVIVTDVIHAAEARRYADLLAGSDAAVHMVTLLPPLEIALARDAARRFSIPERVRAVHRELADELARGELPGAALDSGADRTPQDTADRLQDLLPGGAALLVPPEPSASGCSPRGR